MSVQLNNSIKVDLGDLDKQPLDLTRTYTADEFEQLPDDGNRYELVEGWLELMPPTGDEHGRILDELAFALNTFVRTHKLGRIWFTTGVKLDMGNVPEPDLSFVTANRVPPVGPKALTVVPDLAVEVWSPSDLESKKRRDKALARIQRMQKAGVKLIWSINPRNRTVEVYRGVEPAPHVLNLHDVLDGEDVVHGFQMKVSDIFNF